MTATSSARAERVIARCRELARISDVPGETTRTFLSPATRDAHALVSEWMRQAGLAPRTDDIGNVRATRHAHTPNAPTLVIFSHIDTVPNAGAFDGPLGVVLGLEVIAALGATPLPFHLELIAFSEEEGVRFSLTFLSSRAVVGELDEAALAKTDAEEISVAEAIRNFGLAPERIAASCPLAPETFAALEVHIEQGPVLESEDASLAVVDAITGQSRFTLTFEGNANHAGTTPMSLRHDALAAAAEWIVAVERVAAAQPQLAATVGRMEVLPGAANVVPGLVKASLDVRHPQDEVRLAAVATLLAEAERTAAARGVRVHAVNQTEQKAVTMDPSLTTQLQQAARRAGVDAKAMFSGAGHDAMIVAPHVPTTMLFVRSPGGLSHHPDENVREQDIEAALATTLDFVTHLNLTPNPNP